MTNRYPLILNSAAGQLQELPAGDSLDLGGESLLGIKLGSAGVPSISFTGDLNTGIFSPAANTIAFAEGGTEAARIDSGGRLLINTSTTMATGTADLLHISSVYGGNVNLGRNDETATADNSLGKIGFWGNAGGAYELCAQINGEVDGDHVSGDKPGRLVFSTTADGASSPTERMRISNGGHIYIVDAATYAANYNGGANGGFRWRAPTAQSNSAMEGYSASTNTSRHMLFSNSNGVVGAITTAASATTYATSSDYRLKENVAPVTDGITRLQQLKPSRFNFIADPDTVVDGFLAHEAAEVVPECVTGTKDEVDEDGNPVYQGIDQSKLVPLLTAALQEAIGEIESLKARVAALESA